jgi:amidophosphoribosyltransferase
MKNRYVGRTFIMPTQEAREQAVRLKLNPIKSTVEGRDVTVIDDSIVRGTTSGQLVDLVREAGAQSVHVRIGAPPIRAPCYMGINMASRDELIAADRTTEAVAAEIGADSLSYLSLDAITTAIGKSESDLCVGCVSGEYPYDVPGEATDRAVEHPAARTASDG